MSDSAAPSPTPSASGPGDVASKPPTSAPPAPASNHQDEDGDLFGADDDEDDAPARRKPAAANVDAIFGDDDDDDDDDVRPVGRQRQRAESADSEEPAPRQASAAPSDESMDERQRRDLELIEDPEDEPMGAGRGGGGASSELQVAQFALPSQPVRRGADHWFSRLPNFMQYRAEPFSSQSFDEDAEEASLAAKADVQITDKGLRSLLTTTNTIRWRWSKKRDAEGKRIPESNARIVKWSDGTMSLQLGSEMYDITQTSEKLARSSTGQGALPLSHVFVNQETEGVLQAEGPLAGSLGLRPVNLQSETHRRLARAVKQQRTQRVQQAVVQRGSKDPALEKEEKEKQLRMESLKKERKLRKEREARDARTGDEQLLMAPRRGGGGRVHAAAGGPRDYVDSDEERGGFIDDDEGTGDRDGFVVDDPDEDAEGEDDEGGDAMDVDDTPDEMELAERKIEEANAARKKEKQAAAAAAAAGGGDDGGVVRSAKRRTLVESDEDE